MKLARRTPATVPRHCICAGRTTGYERHPDRDGWWVCPDCRKPCKTYLDAKEEQGHDW